MNKDLYQELALMYVYKNADAGTSPEDLLSMYHEALNKLYEEEKNYDCYGVRKQ